MALTKLERQDAAASGEGSDLIRLYEAVADLCTSRDPDDCKAEFLSILHELITSNRLRIKLGSRWTEPNASEVVAWLAENWPQHASLDHPRSTEMLIYLESNCQIWWSVWGEPNRRFIEGDRPSASAQAANDD